MDGNNAIIFYFACDQKLPHWNIVMFKEFEEKTKITSVQCAWICSRLPILVKNYPVFGSLHLVSTSYLLYPSQVIFWLKRYIIKGFLVSSHIKHFWRRRQLFTVYSTKIFRDFKSRRYKAQWKTTENIIPIRKVIH